MRFLFFLAFGLASIQSVFTQANFTLVADSDGIYSITEARGLAIADYDNDGDDDILVASAPVRLLRNEGNFQFSNQTSESGLSGIHARSAIWFDANNDGWLDVFVSSTSQTRLYLNDRLGGFGNPTSFSAADRQSINVGDLNGDQWPDIYSANFQQKNHTYINQANGQFASIANDMTASNYDMGAVLIDIDEDGDLDIYLTHDNDQPNDLLINDGQAVFTNAPAQWNLANRSNAMGIDFADFNLDGRYDFFIANLRENDLLIRKTTNTFEEIGASAGVDDPGMAWGTVCFDYDNDGYTDIYFNNEYYYSPHPNQLLRNNGDLTFTNMTNVPLENKLSGYGCATADFNNDGKLDLALVNLQSTNSLKIFQNEEPIVGNWAQFTLVGNSSNKFGIGAKIRLYADEQVYMQDIRAGSGYRSQNSYRAHIGFGAHAVIDSVVVLWPDGLKQKLTAVAINTHHLIHQSEGLSVFNPSVYATKMDEPNSMTNPPIVESEEVSLDAAHSTARNWIEMLLEAIRGDFARPTVHARNLFHVSLAMYDAWAAYDEVSTPIFLGKSLGTFSCPFTGINEPTNIESARKEAISYAAYRLIKHRFANSPSADETLGRAFKLLQTLGYSPDVTSTDYSTGSAAALGNYIAAKIIEFGLQDGSNESNGYKNQFYTPVNAPLKPTDAGNPTMTNPNRWQQLEILGAIDQSGNPVANISPFLSPEWGHVVPFALTDTDRTMFQRDGDTYPVYHDPGAPPFLDVQNGGGSSDFYKWNFEMVGIWSSHLDPSDEVMIDISPATIGNVPDSSYPTTLQEYLDFYGIDGTLPAEGYSINPITGQPYAPQIVPRGDYTRVLAEFWADGPHSETPPGHWFSILNYVTDHPQFERKFLGQGAQMNLLEWDVKSYVTLGGALHDVAITVWGMKGYYDFPRPISSLRFLADLGQSTSEDLPNYHPAGITLRDGYIELVGEEDPLVGESQEHLNKIKIKAWRGPLYIQDPDTDVAGAGWILAENWWPYQRPTFVTPPFAGYISGHSTYSRAAAEVLAQLTGSEYFPGGLGEFPAAQNEYLVFEEGPSVNVTLQWAKFKDASDQCSLSRIWGGIHPPVDDIAGRHIGKIVGHDALNKALIYFNGEVISNVQDSPIRPKLYPNPLLVGQYLQIHSEDQPLRLTAWNMYGQLIFKDVNPQEIQLAFHIPGLYILQVKTPSETILEKIWVR